MILNFILGCMILAFAIGVGMFFINLVIGAFVFVIGGAAMFLGWVFDKLRGK